MITLAQPAHPHALSTPYHDLRTPRVLSLFLSGTLLLAAAILSGCTGVTSAKSNAVASTNQNTTGAGALSASPSTLNFGNVSVGSSSNQSLTLTNSGTSAVSISQANASGAGFTIGGVALPANLNPGASATFTASFAPGSAGTVSGAASFSSSQLSSAFAVQMTGTGMAVAPAITAQPNSQSVLVGQTAIFSVTASGTAPLGYQWRKNGLPISGATSSSYITPAETSSDNGAQFTVIVSNSAGSVTSNVATLTVTTVPVAPSITTQPANQTIFAGQTATFSVIANGTSPLSYQWQKNGAAIGGATSSSYTTPSEPLSDNGALFSVVVSNSVGNVTSNSATLTVNPDPPAPTITSQPASQTITAGQTATFSVTASSTAPLSYQWQKNGTAINTATSSSYTTPAETTSDNGSQFTVVVSNAGGSVTSNIATLTVNPPPPGALTPSNTSLAFGNVIINNNSALPVTFTNSGSVNITVSTVTISGAGFTASGISNGQIITPGQVVTLNVTFAPAATGNVTGNVTVTSNASNSPTSVSLSGSGVLAHTATLNWTASTSTVIGYNVYRGSVSGGPYTRLNSSPVSGTQYVDSTPLAGLTYFYVATAVASGNVESTYSNQVPAIMPIP